MWLLSSSQTLWLGLSSPDLSGAAASEGMAHLHSLQAILVLMGWWRMGCQCPGSLLHISRFFIHWESVDLLIEVTLPWLVSDSIELGPGSSQTKKDSSGDRLKLWQPGACSYNFKPNFWLMLDVWTWAMQLAPCCLNQLGWMIESWLDLPESRCKVWSDLSRINKNKFSHCLQTQHISVSLC